MILAKSGISTVPTSVVTGNLGVSPAAATFITGFSLTADSTNVFSKSLQVSGKVYASNYAPPTPSNMTTAVNDMELAFTDAEGGVLPKNVFWQVSGSVNIGTTAHCEGVVLTRTSAILQTGASIKGRLLAQTAVTLDASTVAEP